MGNQVCGRVCETFGRRRDDGLSRGSGGALGGSSPLLGDISGSAIVASDDLDTLPLPPAVSSTRRPTMMNGKEEDKEAEERNAAAMLLCRVGEVVPSDGVSSEGSSFSTVPVSTHAGRIKDVSRFYLHCLGAEETARLIQLRGRLPTLLARARAGSTRAAAKSCLLFWGANLEVPGDATDIILLKHLRAEEGIVDLAAERLVRTLMYRAEEEIDELVDIPLEEVGVRYAAAGFVGGTDVHGRPVAVSRTPEGQDADALMGDIPGFVRYNFWIKEQAFKRMKLARGLPEDICQIIDLSAAKFGPPPRAIQESSKVFKLHCPESNGVNIFANAPSWVVGVFKLCSKFADPRTFSRIRLIGVDEHLKLFELVPPESVPIFLGGMRPEGPNEVSDAGPCQVVEVVAGEAAEVKALDVLGPVQVNCELRVCSQAIAYQVLFSKADARADEPTVVVAESFAARPLQASEGVVTVRYQTKEAGTVSCRFHCEAARFGSRAKTRVCVVRATALPKDSEP